MIKSIRLQNFFGFQDCTINLEKGENVLVGINGSGKSNFFKAIQLLKEGVVGKGLSKTLYDDFGGLGNTLFKGRAKNKNNKLYLTYTFEPVITWKYKGVALEEIIYTIGIYDFLPAAQNYAIIQEAVDLKLKNETIRILEYQQDKVKIIDFLDRTEEQFTVKNLGELALSEAKEKFDLRKIYDFISNITVYEPFDTSRNGKMRFGGFASGLQRMNADGSNLTQILNELHHSDKKTFKKILSALNRINTNYTGIDFQTFASSTVQLMLEENPFNQSIPVGNISDGTLKFLCLITILYHPDRGTVVCLDEPELGLHPDMIHTLSEAIKYAAQTSQIIISTHSPQLLDWFEFKNVRIFEKDDNNATIVKELDEKKFEGWYDKYMLGDMWLKGDIGGNRW